MSDIDFTRYRIGLAVIDGPDFAEGTEVAVRVHARVIADRFVDGNGAAHPIKALEIRDWAGPWEEKHDPGDPPAIPEHVLKSCVRALEACISAADLASTEEMARAVLEQVGRMLRPDAGEAVTLALGVARLDIEKLARAGDRIASEVWGTHHGALVSARDAWHALRQHYGPKDSGA